LAWAARFLGQILRRAWSRLLAVHGEHRRVGEYLLFVGPVLILFTESLCVRFSVRVEEFLAALLPRRLEFWCCDVLARPAFPGNGTQVLAEFFQSRPAEEPVAVVDLVDDKTGLEDNHGGIMGLLRSVTPTRRSQQCHATPQPDSTILEKSRQD
jgi:hypothetical protein